MYREHKETSSIILGPLLFLIYINDLSLLFLIYINDLSQVSDKRFAVLFADDSNMFITGKKLIEMAKSMNEELQKISQWLKTNKLSLNILKPN